MTVTTASEPARALAASNPPKPPPRMTTRWAVLIAQRPGEMKVASSDAGDEVTLSMAFVIVLEIVPCGSCWSAQVHGRFRCALDASGKGQSRAEQSEKQP